MFKNDKNMNEKSNGGGVFVGAASSHPSDNNLASNNCKSGNNNLNLHSHHSPRITQHTSGISLISLIITIIVIIILAAIVIFTGLNTPDRANLAKFMQGISDFRTAVTQDFMNKKAQYAVEKKQRTDAQIYYIIANGLEVDDVDINNTTPTGNLVSDFSVDGIEGTYAYEISKTNEGKISGWKYRNYYESTEKHYITDKGDVFVVPGYRVDENGVDKWYINERLYHNGLNAIDDEQDDNELPTALGTKPYLPSDKFSQLDGTTLENGLVITDKRENEEFGNEYVWIEVPSSYVDSRSTNGPNYESVTNTVEGEESYYIAIENALIAYVENDLLTGSDHFTSRAGCKDEWYDRYNATVIGTTVAGDKYGKVKAITSSNYSTAKSYYGTSLYTNSELTTQAGDNFSSGTTYYAKMTETLLGDINGCGLSYSDYNMKKKTMLESIYKNGGFWIGRYEAGQTGDTGRINNSVTIDGIIPLSKPNLIPIFNVTCSQSQQIASRINNIGSYNSSLMFGIQWDLVLKHLKNKGIATSLLTGDSSSWGNYLNTTNAELIRGKYARSQVVSFRTIWS